MRLLTLTLLSVSCLTVQAGSRCCQPVTSNCCPAPVCSSSSSACGGESISYSSGPTTKLWKGKDGVIRETITHWEALHRSVEADQLETELAGLKSDFESTSAELVALREQAAAQQAEMEKQIAALQAQLKQQTEVASKQGARADAAEKAAASAQESGRKIKVMLTKVQKNLNQTASERDTLKTRNEELQTKVKAATEARAKTQAQIKKLRNRIQQQQKAIEQKTAELAAKKEEEAEPEPEKPAEEEKPAKEESAEEKADEEEPAPAPTKEASPEA